MEKTTKILACKSWDGLPLNSLRLVPVPRFPSQPVAASPTEVASGNKDSFNKYIHSLKRFFEI